MNEPHPLTELIPKQLADRDQVAADIAQSGMKKPVLIYEGKILEGRVRYLAARDVGIQPRLRDWVLWVQGDDIEPLDWLVRRNVEEHALTELGLIRLVVAVLPAYRRMKGQTNRLLYEALGKKLSWNKIRALNWLEETGAPLDHVLDGSVGVFEAARKYGLAPDTRDLALGKSYGAGDKFDEATQPIVRYLKAWKRKGYEFRHLNPKEASRRVSLFESMVEEMQAALVDLKKRSVMATLSAPPERRKK